MRIRTLVALSLFLGIFGAGLRLQGLGAQASPTVAPTPQWEIDADGKRAFDVASVKQNTSGSSSGSNLPFSGDAQTIKGSQFTATDMPPTFYISVAYKLNVSQSRSVEAQLPKWAKEERFDIQGSIPANTTKDQVRLMIQSLLADRFHLKAHFETRETPVYAAVLAKPGVTGPNLKPHSENPPCPDSSAPLSLPGTEDTWGLPATCGGVVAAASSHTIFYAARNVSMKSFAENLPVVPNNGLDRPVVDQTALAGNFDFVLKYSPQPADGEKLEQGDYQTAFLEALKEQLGIKLDSATAPVESIVIDHIEEPSAN